LREKRGAEREVARYDALIGALDDAEVLIELAAEVNDEATRGEAFEKRSPPSASSTRPGAGAFSAASTTPGPRSSRSTRARAADRVISARSRLASPCRGQTRQQDRSENARQG